MLTGHRKNYLERFSKIKNVTGWQNLSASKIGKQIDIDHGTVIKTLRRLEKTHPSARKWFQNSYQQVIKLPNIDTLVAPKTTISLRKDLHETFLGMKKIKKIELYSATAIGKMFKMHKSRVMTFMEKLEKAGTPFAKRWVKHTKKRTSGPSTPSVSIIKTKKPVPISKGERELLSVLETLEHPENVNIANLGRMARIDPSHVRKGIKKLADAGHEISSNWINKRPKITLKKEEKILEKPMTKYEELIQERKDITESTTLSTRSRILLLKEVNRDLRGLEVRKTKKKNKEIKKTAHDDLISMARNREAENRYR